MTGSALHTDPNVDRDGRPLFAPTGVDFLRCLACDRIEPLSCQADDRALVCRHGHSVPLVDGIPRFVTRNHYTQSFGLQWTTFRKTQLDSFTGTTISRDRLTRMAGGSLDVIRGKTVLEAGCGAGRFTEILLQAGATVCAVDASSAVEANRDNCQTVAPGQYVVCQADLLDLPFAFESFDIVMCAGVIQHTPDPEKTISTLCKFVRPSGQLLLDHYTPMAGVSWFDVHKRLLRRALLRTPVGFRMRFCQALVGALWPLHRAAWRLRLRTGWRWPHGIIRIASPVFDYQKRFPELSDNLQRQWAFLDTHDALTDEYKHLRTAEQIIQHLTACRMVNIFANYAGNGVEARAKRPWI